MHLDRGHPHMIAIDLNCLGRICLNFDPTDLPMLNLFQSQGIGDIFRHELHNHMDVHLSEYEHVKFPILNINFA